MGLGAVAGLLKAGIMFLFHVSAFGGGNKAIYLILVLLFSPYGICVIITTAISNLAIGEGERTPLPETRF
jgi:hypothetical protein